MTLVDFEILRPYMWMIPIIGIGLWVLFLWIRRIIRHQEFARWDKMAREAAERGDSDGIHNAVTGMMGFHK